MYHIDLREWSIYPKCIQLGPFSIYGNGLEKSGHTLPNRMMSLLNWTARKYFSENSITIHHNTNIWLLKYVWTFRVSCTLLLVVGHISLTDYRCIIQILENTCDSADVAYATVFTKFQLYDDVIKWKHFPRYWPFVRGIHRSPVNSPHKGQWRGALMFLWSGSKLTVE